MKVATWRGESRFTIDDAPDPVAGPGQIVVAVHAAGICGTDIHATQGLFPWTPPLVLGHEYTGVVREVGRGVSKRLLGRAVACEPSYGCGECAACEAGRISQCPGAVRVTFPVGACSTFRDGRAPAPTVSWLVRVFD